jgi:hypothetical protein
MRALSDQRRRLRMLIAAEKRAIGHVRREWNVGRVGNEA